MKAMFPAGAYGIFDGHHLIEESSTGKLSLFYSIGDAEYGLWMLRARGQFKGCEKLEIKRVKLALTSAKAS